VRTPTTLKSGQIVYTRFHEGLDIKPIARDAKGDPLDEVLAIAAGEVVHFSGEPGASNYGRYVVVRHNWGEGPFFSLYAHLREIRCTVGQKVELGTPLGLMGYSGAGIDSRRAHVHLELTMFLSSRFQTWHDLTNTTPNRQLIYNGLNLVGLDAAQVFREYRSHPDLSIASLIKGTQEQFRVAVPGHAEMEILKNYPWLLSEPRSPGSPDPTSWEISFSGWGLPVKIAPSNNIVSAPVVTWARPSEVPQYSLTRGILNGIAGRYTLSTSGLQYVQLVTGLFEQIRSPIKPGESIKPPPAKPQSKPSSKGKSKSGSSKSKSKAKSKSKN
jgi:Peptidase family M23